MTEPRRCWWCGIEAQVDPELPASGGLLRDDATMDGRESWICDAEHNEACNARGRPAPRCLAALGPAYPGGHVCTCNYRPGHLVPFGHYCLWCQRTWQVNDLPLTLPGGS